jgi:hypothetical protein
MAETKSSRRGLWGEDPIVITSRTAYFNCVAVDPKSMNVITGGRFGIFARLRAALKFQAPVGYEDEAGFHLGKERAHNERRDSFRLQDLSELIKSNREAGRDFHA